MLCVVMVGVGKACGQLNGLMWSSNLVIIRLPLALCTYTVFPLCCCWGVPYVEYI